jgi:hypothetical protein
VASALSLAQLETRVKNALAASAPASHWAVASIDEAITLALEEYSRARPYVQMSTFTLSAREASLSLYATLVSIQRIWYPYTPATPEYPPAWIDFDFWFDSGVPWVRLHTDSVPVAGSTARMWWRGVHNLNGLAGFGATTFVVGDDGILEVGACAYACLARSTELDETLQNMAVSTPNYGALASLFFDRFHGMLNASRGVIL